MDIFSETIDHYNFFREVQVCPLSDKFNYKGWLNNFTDKYEKELASLMVDFFNYYSDEMVNQMLRTSVGKAGYELSQYFSDWEHDNFKNRCYYTFIPGENPNPSDSGNLFIRKLRDELNIPENRLFDYRDIYNLIDTLKGSTPIVFVDDFVGSGAQCCTAWLSNRGGKFNLNLMELSKHYNHKFIYAPLIINSKGYNLIRTYCDGLILSPSHIIYEEYNLFNENCICWRNNKQFYEDGVALILNKSRQLGIPSTDGKNVNDEKGFQKQGLAIAFGHGAPDAIPAIFYWETDDWTPLIKKNYSR